VADFAGWPISPGSVPVQTVERRENGPPCSDDQRKKEASRETFFSTRWQIAQEILSGIRTISDHPDDILVDGHGSGFDR
jgi:hypothetical protein